MVVSIQILSELYRGNNTETGQENRNGSTVIVISRMFEGMAKVYKSCLEGPKLSGICIEELGVAICNQMWENCLRSAILKRWEFI